MRMRDVAPAQWARRILLIDIPSVAAGAINGYCDAQGIPLHDSLENVLSYGPAGIHGCFGLRAGAQLVREENINDQLEDVEHYLSKSRKIDNAGTIAISGVMNAGIGALETVAGYWIGRAAGHLQDLAGSAT